MKRHEFVLCIENCFRHHFCEVGFILFPHFVTQSYNQMPSFRAVYYEIGHCPETTQPTTLKICTVHFIYSWKQYHNSGTNLLLIRNLVYLPHFRALQCNFSLEFVFLLVFHGSTALNGPGPPRVVEVS
jgi:hypothetical protein